MGTTVKQYARYWGWCTGSHDRLHRFRPGSRVSLCGLRQAPGTVARDDVDAVGAHPCADCQRQHHRELEEAA